MEEDIKHLKELKVELENMSITGPTSEDRLNAHRKSLAISNILNELERLQNENEELKEQVNMFDETYSGAIKESKKWFGIARESIPKSVIQDKIEKFRCKLTWGYNDWKYDEKIYQAEYKIIYDIEKELLNKGE